jgi:hypothetical protein
MKQFKRFIVFEWDETDSKSPFGCVIDSFDDEAEAACFFYKKVENDLLDLRFCVFDCDERKIVYQLGAI